MEDDEIEVRQIGGAICWKLASRKVRLSTLAGMLAPAAGRLHMRVD